MAVQSLTLMDVGRCKKHLFGLAFIICLGIYSYTCIMQRKHGLSDSHSSPKWTNFLYDLVLNNTIGLYSDCSTCILYDLQEDLAYEYFYRYRCFPMAAIGNVSLCLYDDYGQSFGLKRRRPQQAINILQRWLNSSEKIGLIDIGSKLGIYSLNAAKMGHSVLAVEPNMGNVRRFHKAVKVNKLEDRITLLTNAISNERGTAELLYNVRDPGHTQILQIEQQRGHRYDDHDLYTMFITLNDLVQFCDFDEAVLRIDVEGFEHRAFAQASDLFDEIDISLIIMEWSRMKSQLMTKDKQNKNLILNMITFLVKRSFIPKSLQMDILSTAKPELWPDDIIWKKR